MAIFTTIGAMPTARKNAPPMPTPITLPNSSAPGRTMGSSTSLMRFAFSMATPLETLDHEREQQEVEHERHGERGAATGVGAGVDLAQLGHRSGGDAVDLAGADAERVGEGRGGQRLAGGTHEPVVRAGAHDDGGAGRGHEAEIDRLVGHEPLGLGGVGDAADVDGRLQRRAEGGERVAERRGIAHQCNGVALRAVGADELGGRWRRRASRRGARRR